MFIFFFADCMAVISITLPMTTSGWNGSHWSTSLSASTRLKSRISLMSACNVSPLVRTVDTYSLCNRSKFVSSNNCPTAMSPFKGVRISCDMCAKNLDLASVAASARAIIFSAFSSSSRRLNSSVTSD